jgi:hypothetical protein
MACWATVRGLKVRGLQVRGLLAALALALGTSSLAAPGPARSRLALPEPLDRQHPAHQAFSAATVRLLLDDRPRFELRYAGPPVQLRGTVCYRFAGYSETCRQARGQWLTGADPLVFLAPGQVPQDLLAGYRLEVRLPQTLAGTFTFDPEQSRASNGKPGNSTAQAQGQP